MTVSIATQKLVIAHDTELRVLLPLMLDGYDHVSVMAGVGVGFGVGLGLAVAIALEVSPHPSNTSVIMTMIPTLAMRCIGDTPLRPVLETHGRFRNLK